MNSNLNLTMTYLNHSFSSLDVILLVLLFLKLTSCQNKFGYRLAAKPFRNYSIVSIDACMLECKARSKCKALEYNRRAKFCMLLDVDLDSGVSEIWDPKLTFSEKKWWKEESVSSLCSICDDNQVCREQACEIEEHTNTVPYEKVASETIPAFRMTERSVMLKMPPRFAECGHIFQSYKGQTAVLGNKVQLLSRLQYVFLCFDLKTGIYETVYIRGTCENNGAWNVPSITCYNVYDLVKALGCYSDHYHFRTLVGGYYSRGSMTIPMCASFCYNRGFLYFGLQYSVQCYCGSSPRATTPSSICTITCGGDPTTYCGRVYALNAYMFNDKVTF